jgi:DNA-directed RNA polymerase sigma subunit (sigma70/sigma32)
MITYNFEDTDLMTEFEKLSPETQNILAWKSGMYGMVKTSKTLAKELKLTVEQVDEIYTENIQLLKNKMLENE